MSQSAKTAKKFYLKNFPRIIQYAVVGVAGIMELPCWVIEFNQHWDLNETIKMDNNPSYGVSMGEEKATAFSSTVTNSATTKQYDYDYVCDDHFLHHNTSCVCVYLVIIP